MTFYSENTKTILLDINLQQFLFVCFFCCCCCCYCYCAQSCLCVTVRTAWHPNFFSKTEVLSLPASESVGQQLGSLGSIFKTSFKRDALYSRSHSLLRSLTFIAWLMLTQKILTPILQFRAIPEGNSDSRDTHRISQNLQNSVAAQLLPLTSFAYSSLSEVLTLQSIP